MLKKIIQFELRSRLKTSLFYLCWVLMLFQVIVLTKGVYDYYTNDAVLINSSTVLYKNFAGGGMLFIIIIAVVTGMVLYKDIEYKTAATLYSFPINEKKFFIGKFLAAYIINIIISIGFVLGMLLLPYSGIGKPEDFGNPPLLQMLQGYFILMIPNIFTLTAACFIPLVLTRKLASSYLGILFVTLLFMILEGVSHTVTNTKFIEILEPFSYVYVSEALDVVPADLKNTTFLPLTSTFFINKFFWFSLTFIGLFWAYKRFSFAYFIEKTVLKEKTKIIKNTNSSIFETVSNKVILPKVSLKYTTVSNISKFFRLSKLEFINMVRPKSFRIVFGIVILMFLLQNFLFNASYYIGPELPLTTNMTINRLTLGVFIIILIMIWTGELIFKEKISNLEQITDTLPLPVWVRLLSKYLAMSILALCLSLAIILAGLITQIFMGYTNFEFGLYIEDVLGYKWGWINYLMLMTLPFFIAGVTGKRFLTHILSIGFFIFLIIAFELGIIEDHRLGVLVGIPGLEDYSEITGYGIFSTASFWFFCLWGSLSVFFMFGAIYFWKRGNKNDWSKKLKFKGEQLNWMSKIVALASLVLFFVLQSFITKNIEDNFKTIAQREIKQASYEKKYKKLEKYPQPIIKNIKASVDLFPEERKVNYSATLTLKNEGKLSIDSLYINLTDFTEIEEIRINNTVLKSVWEDKKHFVYGYILPKTLIALNEIELYIKATKQYHGFSTINPQEDLAIDGLLLKRDLFPVFGYNSKKELDENKKRRNHNLDKITSKMPSITDEISLKQNYFSLDAHKVTTNLTVSTSKNQQIIATGKTIKKWTLNNRNYANFENDYLSNFEIQIASASYTKDTENLEGINTIFWYKNSHRFNLDIYKQAISYGLKFVNSYIGTYPYKELNIAEISYYGKPFYSSPNLILISEKEGWRADTSLKKEKSYIYFTMVTQLVKQQLISRSEIANVQGAEMLIQTLPEVIALQAIQQKFGKEIVDLYLQTKKSNYQKQRSNEPNTEPPLVYADGSDYLEPNKGVVALFYLSKEVGFEQFNKIVCDFINKFQNKPVVFEELYQQLLKVLPKTKREKVRVIFEKVT